MKHATTTIQPGRQTDSSNGRGDHLLRMGVIGYGYWGPQVTRNFHNLETSRVIAVADKRAESQKRARHAHPDIKIVSDAAEILNSTEIDAVAIVTPVWTHLRAGKESIGKRKTRICREALYQYRRSGRRISGARRAKKTDNHGGPHIPIYRGCEEDSSTRRRWHFG